MKIVFIHLSDLHLQDGQGAHPSKIEAVVNSLVAFSPFDGLVVILSGDIAASGEENQYKIASNFLGRLMSKLLERYNISRKNAKILIVPGNHDINWGGNPRLNSEIIRNFDENEKEIYLKEELDSMRNYFLFSDRNGCFFTQNSYVDYGQLITRKILHFTDGYRIEANLINTAPLSCNKDDGLHYLPNDAIQTLNKPSKADISLVVMHHSPDWFTYSQKKELEGHISDRCSLAFYGHEHFPGSQNVLYDNGSRIVKQAGGAWWQNATPLNCEYYAALFDTRTLKYSLKKFSWNPSRSMFSGSSNQEHVLMPKSLCGSGLSYKEEYIISMSDDPKKTIAQSIADYFVFPSLRFDMSKEYLKGKTINKMEDFIEFIKSNKYVAVIGGSNCGKTTLLRMLFMELRFQHIVLFCGTDDITGRSQENILKELVQNTYGEDAYSLFQSIPPEDKVIIIDDLHRISPKHLKKFLSGIEDLFGTIVVASEETAQFDIVQMVKDNIKSNKEFKKTSISRLYAEKRLELIQKIVLNKSDNDVIKAAEISRTLEQCLNSYKLGFRTDIDFVVQFVDYYCMHLGELIKSDATVFSKVFEASIERAITPHLTHRRENCNDIIIALSEIAYYVHFHKEYPVSAIHINDVIDEYCNYYDNRYLTAARFIEIAVNSGLLVSTPNGYEYRFSNKNYLSYFVAKALNRRYHDNGDTSDLEQIVQQSCFSINGDILMFMTYISDNVSIPRLLLCQTASCVSDWAEFNLLAVDQKYLKSVPTRELTPPSDNEKEAEVHSQDAIEKDCDSCIETLDIYDYDETEIDKLNNQLIRALLQLKIIARNFSAFISILPGPQKKEYVLAMYQLPNKIFNKWADSIDKGLEQLVEEIVTWQDAPDFEGKKLSREGILRFFQEISMDMLLNMYYMVSSFGANENTVDYLSQQDYIEHSINYRIERLMFWEKIDDFQSVIKDAESLCNEQEHGIAKSMVLTVLRHLLVHSDKIPDRERRRISQSYFTAQAQAGLLIDRQRAKNNKEV